MSATEPPDIVSSLLAAGHEKTEAPDPVGFYYRILFESGMPEVGFSRLAPKEFVDKVLEARELKDWIRWDDGDGFYAGRVISVKVIPAEDADQ